MKTTAYSFEPDLALRDARIEELDPRWDLVRMPSETCLFQDAHGKEIRLSQFDLLCLPTRTLGLIRNQASERMNALKSEEAIRIPQHDLLGEFYAYRRFQFLAKDLRNLDRLRPWKAWGPAALKARDYFLTQGLPAFYTPKQALAWIVQSLAAEGLTDRQITVHGWLPPGRLEELKAVRLPEPL